MSECCRKLNELGFDVTMEEALAAGVIEPSDFIECVCRSIYFSISFTSSFSSPQAQSGVAYIEYFFAVDGVVSVFKGSGVILFDRL